MAQPRLSLDIASVLNPAVLSSCSMRLALGTGTPMNAREMEKSRVELLEARCWVGLA